MYTEPLLAYIHKKHKICQAKLEDMNLTGLQTYLGKLKHFQRASMAKLLHDWIPTNDFLHKQGRADTNLCPRCQTCLETADHILKCDDKDAQEKRQQ
jgi:hypothetical protein